MSGIFGYAANSADASRPQLLEEMGRRLKHHTWHRHESALVESGVAGLGRVSLGAIQKEPQPASSDNGEFVAVLDGEFYNAEQVALYLFGGRRALAADHVALLIQGYLLEGKRFFRRLDGKFAAAIWDARQKKLILATDRFGMKPLYYSRTAGRMLFGSEIKAILADDATSRAAHFRGLAQFFTFGHMLGEDTLLEAVRLVPAAGLLAYDVDEDRLEIEKYWSLAEIPDHATVAPGDWLDRVDDAMHEAVARRASGAGRLGLSLSGGLDARTILGLIDCQRRELQTVSLGMDGSLDHRSAAKLAALAGCRHHQYHLNEGFLSQFENHLRTMVHLTDGHYLDQCIVLPTLPIYRELGIDVLLRGHAGELMHMNKAYNFSLDKAAWRIRTDADLEAWLSRRLSAYMLDGIDGPLFAGLSPAEAQELSSDSLRSCLAETAGTDRALQQVWQLFVGQRLRRETAASLAMFGSVVETRVPFLDAQLVELLLSMPPELKSDDRIQTHILRRRRPEFLKVVNSNTGASMGAGTLRRQVASFQLRVLAKLGVKGYQPYERLGLWLRRELRGLVKAVLLDDRCLQRGIFDPDTVAAAVHQHQDAGRNHTFLLMAMMIYELGQREFVDGEVNWSGEPVGAPVADLTQ